MLSWQHKDYSTNISLTFFPMLFCSTSFHFERSFLQSDWTEKAPIFVISHSASFCNSSHFFYCVHTDIFM
uniref:Uncharacterized protein n=1 Tax=Anguilla anguilla TaxID=7936 RepID=A0A0E9WLA6_ANGAN